MVSRSAPCRRRSRCSLGSSPRRTLVHRPSRRPRPIAAARSRTRCRSRRTRLGEGEERGAEPQLQVVALEEAAAELGEDDQVGRRVAPIHRPLDLVEHPGECVASLSTRYARRDDAIGMACAFPCTAICTRIGVCVRSTMPSLDVERVLHRAGRVVLRAVERGEVDCRLADLGSVGHREGSSMERSLDALDGARRSDAAAHAAAAGSSGDVERVGLELLHPKLRVGEGSAALQAPARCRYDRVDAAPARRSDAPTARQRAPSAPSVMPALPGSAPWRSRICRRIARNEVTGRNPSPSIVRTAVRDRSARIRTPHTRRAESRPASQSPLPQKGQAGCASLVVARIDQARGLWPAPRS